MCKLFVGFSTPVQNFLTLPCYLLIFLSLFSALLHFVFFNFYYIITERFYLRTLSFYFKIYYKNKSSQKFSNIKKPNKFHHLVFSAFTKKPNKPLYLKKPIYSTTPTLFLKNSAALFNYSSPQKRLHRVKSFYKFCIQSPYGYL